MNTGEEWKSLRDSPNSCIDFQRLDLSMSLQQLHFIGELLMRTSYQFFVRVGYICIWVQAQTSVIKLSSFI